MVVVFFRIVRYLFQVRDMDPRMPRNVWRARFHISRKSEKISCSCMGNRPNFSAILNRGSSSSYDSTNYFRIHYYYSEISARDPRSFPRIVCFCWQIGPIMSKAQTEAVQGLQFSFLFLWSVHVEAPFSPVIKPGLEMGNWHHICFRETDTPTRKSFFL